MTTNRWARALAKAKLGPAYWTERAILDFTSSVAKELRGLGLTQQEFAGRVGKSPAYVSRVLSGTPNVTVKTMAEMAHAVGMRLCVSLSPQEKQEPSFDHFEVDLCDQVTIGTRRVRHGRFVPISSNEEIKMISSNEENIAA